jgi:hypothetical protein
MNGTGTPTTRDYEWERWRGGVDEWRVGVDDKLTGISGQLDLLLSTVRGSELSDAGQVAKAAQRRSVVGWIAPNLPSLLGSVVSGGVALAALAVALGHH